MSAYWKDNLGAYYLTSEKIYAKAKEEDNKFCAQDFFMTRYLNAPA